MIADRASNTIAYSKETLAVLHCMFLLSPDGQGVDLQEVDELLRAKHGLTTEQADDWFGAAAREGAIERGPDRSVQ